MSAVYADMGSLIDHGRNVVSFYLLITLDDQGGYIVQGSDVSSEIL